MGDIIAEVYGYKISRQIIWYSFIAMFIFDMLPALIIKIPSPSFWTHQASYDFIVGHLPRTFLGDFIAINAGQFLNVYILTKWKVVVRGKYFALRSLCATAIGEAVFTILAFSIMFVGTMPFSVWGQAMLFSYIFKAAFAFIAVYPALFLTRIIKKVENLDVYDTHTNFNPFSLTIK